MLLLLSSTLTLIFATQAEEKPSIHRVIQNLASGNVGASDLQQAQPFAKQSMCKHMLDTANCKDEDADDANGQILNHDVYTKPIRVYVDVVADLMHAGHIEFFKKAKSMGDYLIVGVLSDADVASYKRIPILTLEERVAAVQACRYVDEVIAAPPMRVDEKWLKEHQIDFLVHGDDFDKKTMEWWYSAAMKMGIFRTVPYTQGISTTSIIKRITDRYLGDDPQPKQK